MNNAPSSAALASLMTKEKLGPDDTTTATIKANHLPQFKEQQKLVRNMEVRAVKIKCCVILAAFEIYAAVELQTRYNSFCPH